MVAVGLAEIKWSTSPEDVLIAFSLGSCVAIAVWDPVSGVGGMAHVVLPKSPEGSLDGENVPGKYGDTAVHHLCRTLSHAGADFKRLKVWLAGGAHVLKGVDLPGGDIGASNTKAVLEALRKLGFADPQKSVGRDYGRTMKLYVREGRATVYSVARGEKDI